MAPVILPIEILKELQQHLEQTSQNQLLVTDDQDRIILQVSQVSRPRVASSKPSPTQDLLSTRPSDDDGSDFSNEGIDDSDLAQLDAPSPTASRPLSEAFLHKTLEGRIKPKKQQKHLLQKGKRVLVFDRHPTSETYLEEELDDLNSTQSSNAPTDTQIENIQNTLPYLSQKAARELYKHVRTVGNHNSYDIWQGIFRHWRQNGIRETQGLLEYSTPSVGENSVVRDVSDKKHEIQAFCKAFRAVEKIEVDINLKDFARRSKLADLQDAYEKAKSVMNTSQVIGSSGQTQVAKAKHRLFGYLFPQHAHIKRPGKSASTQKEFHMLEQQLVKANRWCRIRDELGPGVLALITNRATNNFIQKTMKSQEFDLWLQLMKSINPQAIALGEGLYRALQRIVRKNKMPTRRLRIELCPYKTDNIAISQTDPFLSHDDDELVSDDNEGGQDTGLGLVTDPRVEERFGPGFGDDMSMINSRQLYANGIYDQTHSIQQQLSHVLGYSYASQEIELGGEVEMSRQMCLRDDWQGSVQ